MFLYLKISLRKRYHGNNTIIFKILKKKQYYHGNNESSWKDIFHIIMATNNHLEKLFQLSYIHCQFVRNLEESQNFILKRSIFWGWINSKNSSPAWRLRLSEPFLGRKQQRRFQGKNSMDGWGFTASNIDKPTFPSFVFFGTPVFSAKWEWESPGTSPPPKKWWLKVQKVPIFFLGCFLSGVGSGRSERETYTHQGFTLSNIWYPGSPNMTKLCLCW